MIELRFFHERYNVHHEYYSGDKDVYLRLYFNTPNELRRKWRSLFESCDHYLEGETYSAWDGDGHMLCGGAFDPGDIDDIMDAVKDNCPVSDSDLRLQTARNRNNAVSDLAWIAKVANSETNRANGIPIIDDETHADIVQGYADRIHEIRMDMEELINYGRIRG